MWEWLAAVLLLASAAFMLLAGVGILRMPDVFTRMSATSKAAGLGSSLALLAVATHFARVEVTTRAVAAIVFVFMTIPVAAHMVARAAYLSKAPIAARTRFDELADRYDPRSFDLDGRSEGDAGEHAEADAEEALRRHPRTARDGPLDRHPDGPAADPADHPPEERP